MQNLWPERVGLALERLELVHAALTVDQERARAVFGYRDSIGPIEVLVPKFPSESFGGRFGAVQMTNEPPRLTSSEEDVTFALAAIAALRALEAKPGGVPGLRAQRPKPFKRTPDPFPSPTIKALSSSVSAVGVLPSPSNRP